MLWYELEKKEKRFGFAFVLLGGVVVVCRCCFLMIKCIKEGVQDSLK